MWENPHFHHACVKHWNRLPRELVDSVFESVQNPAWHSPEQPALVDPVLNGETGPPEVHSNSNNSPVNLWDPFTSKKTLINSNFTYSVEYRSRAQISELWPYYKGSLAHTKHFLMSQRFKQMMRDKHITISQNLPLSPSSVYSSFTSLLCKALA